MVEAMQMIVVVKQAVFGVWRHISFASGIYKLNSSGNRGFKLELKETPSEVKFN